MCGVEYVGVYDECVDVYFFWFGFVGCGGCGCFV